MKKLFFISIIFFCSIGYSQTNISIAGKVYKPKGTLVFSDSITYKRSQESTNTYEKHYVQFKKDSLIWIMTQANNGKVSSIIEYRVAIRDLDFNHKLSGITEYNNLEFGTNHCRLVLLSKESKPAVQLRVFTPEGMAKQSIALMVDIKCKDRKTAEKIWKKVNKK